MNDSELTFNREFHVPYSRACKKEIQKRIALHYPADSRENVWTEVQRKYDEYLKDFRTDLGGKRNFHNGKGGTYDCIALMSYYAVASDNTSIAELEEMEGNLFLPAFRRLRFVNCNRKFWRRLLYKAFKQSEKKCNKWNDYKMEVRPYDDSEPISYSFRSCPVAEFAASHGLSELMPAFCNPDYKGMELIHARLVRTHTCADSDICDYSITGDNDSCYLSEHPEYVDEREFRRNI